jgi:hypothetical protein
LRTNAGQRLGETKVPLECVLFLWDSAYAEDPGVGLETWEAIRENLFVILWSLVTVDDKQTRHELPRVRRVSVEERGLKVRVVTPLEAAESVLASFLNKTLLQWMLQDTAFTGRSVQPSEDAARNINGSGILKRHAIILRSVDLTAATDLMPFGVGHALWKGLCKGAPQLSCSLYRFAPRYLGAMRVVEPSGEEWTSQSGLLMGSPVSWPFLNWYNRWLWETAWARSGSYEVFSDDERNGVAIHGDDLIGACPEVVSKEYDLAVTRTYGSVNLLKDHCGPKGGCYVEQLLVRKGHSLSTMETLPIRPLVYLPKDGANRPIWQRGPELSGIVNGSKAPKPVKDAWIRHSEVTYDGAMSSLERMGIHPTLTRTCGGGGFPHLSRKMRRTHPALAKWPRAVRCALAQGTKEATLLLSRMQAVWSNESQDTSALAHQIAEDTYGDWISEIGLSGIPEGELPEDKLYAVDWLQREASAWMAPLFLSQPYRVASGRKSTLPRVGSKLVEQVNSLNSLVPMSRLNDRTNNLELGIDRLLEKHRRSSTVPVSFGLGARMVGKALEAVRVGQL